MKGRATGRKKRFIRVGKKKKTEREWGGGGEGIWSTRIGRPKKAEASFAGGKPRGAQKGKARKRTRQEETEIG